MKYLFFILSLWIFSCTEKQAKTSAKLDQKDINLKDSSTIVTDTDTAHLRNIVEDISKPMSDRKMIKQVLERKDSAEAVADSIQEMKN